MKHTNHSFNEALLDYINQSPTAYHATNEAKQVLLKKGYTELLEKDAWKIGKGKYLVTRNDSSLIAFTTPHPLTDGFKMAGAHTDSPGLKIRPNAGKKANEYFQVGVEVYGGPLLNTWFDRDLSLAGAVFLEMENQTLQKGLIDFEKPLGIIASLAIHLDREANDKKSIQKQKELPPILGITSKSNASFLDLLTIQITKQHPNLKFKKILDYDLSLYDQSPVRIIGINEEFIVGARLDNLLSCFINLEAMTTATTNSLIVLNDHEECGSTSTTGADGSFLKDVLLRICKDQEEYQRMIASSMLISCDNAHALHPNFPEKMDEAHAPVMNLGPAIKINSNQRYATNLETSGIFTHLAQQIDIPVQKFSSRNDMPCGTTIGPITSSHLGVKTIDVGVPTFAMHSIRETAGTKDSFYLYQIISKYMSTN